MILCLAYVVDDRLKAFLVVDIECASTLSPPFLANRRGRGIMCGEWTETFLLQRLEPAGAPGFELLPDLFGFAVARHDDVPMVPAAIDGVESPPPHPAMIGNGQFDEPALVLVEKAGIFRQAGLRLALASGIGELPTVGGTRPTRAHRRAARCLTLARSENRPRVRAKAVRNHVSLCFSSVSRAPGPSMSPLIMSHINRTRPRQGLQLVIRRVAGSQISHIFRRASAGSEALPSLARRVSMQQHAELTCRGNRPPSVWVATTARRLLPRHGPTISAIVATVSRNPSGGCSGPGISSCTGQLTTAKSRSGGSSTMGWTSHVTSPLSIGLLTGTRAVWVE